MRGSRRSKDSFEENDQVWAVFDRDEHPRFDEAIALCDGHGVLVGRSNPCFELWGNTVSEFVGYILNATYVTSGADGRAIVHLHGKLQDGRPFLVRDNRAVPYFYVEHSDRLRAHASGARLVPTELRTLHGARVCRVELAHPQEAPPLRERLHRAGLPTYEADVRFAYRQLIDRGIRRGAHPRRPRSPERGFLPDGAVPRAAASAGGGRHRVDRTLRRELVDIARLARPRIRSRLDEGSLCQACGWQLPQSTRVTCQCTWPSCSQRSYQ